MSVLLAAWALYACPRPDLQSTVEAHRVMQRGSAVLRVGGAQGALFELHWDRPDRLVLWAPQKDGSRHGFGVSANSGWSFSPDSGVRSNLPLKGDSLAGKANHLMGSLPAPLAWVLDADRLDVDLGPARAAFGWTRRATTGMVVWEGVASSGRIVLGFESGTNRLALAEGLPKPDSKATIRYQPFDAKAVRVPSSSPPMAPLPKPEIRDARASGLVRKAEEAYQTLQHVAYTAKSEDGSTDVWLSGQRYRQRTAVLDFASYDRTFWVLDRRNGRLYRGSATLLEAQRWITGLGGQFDPVLLHLLRRINPLRIVMPSEGVLSYVGQTKIAGATTEAVSTSAEGITLYGHVRPDGLLAAIDVANWDARGVTVSQSSVQYRYSNVGNRVDDSVFNPPNVPQTYPLSALRRPRR